MKIVKISGKYFIFLLCAALLSHIIGCAPWVDQLDRDNRKNDVFYEHYTIYGKNFNVDDFGIEIDRLYDEANAEFPKLKDPVARTEGPKAFENVGKIEMSFIHLSDVQIRDERVKLFGKDASRTLDKVIPYFEHGTAPAHDQEHYDDAAYLALIKTINSAFEKLPEDIKAPMFVIHTGDAADAGVVEELYDFIYISNKLAIPWYNVLGNHDVIVFGNFDNKKVYVNDPNLTFQTLHNKFNFINMHGGGHLIDPNINPGPPDAEHLMGITGSRYHGFDLYNREKNAQYTVDGKYLCRDCPGYYSFKLRKVDGNYAFVSPLETNPPQNQKEIVFIVLNTTTTKLGFARGTVGEGNQLPWLRDLLKENAGKLILAFGHHPLDSVNFLDDSYKELIELFHQYHVIAYFCGHTHSHQIRFHEKEGTGQGFWEIITDSILEYPQEGSLVTIRNLGKGMGAIDLQSFGRNITNDCELKEQSDKAFEDAKKDHYREIKEQNRNVRLTFSHPYFSD